MHTMAVQTVVPFPMLFAEPMDSVNIEGVYDEKKQIFHVNPSSPLNEYTFVETATGGHGDTDQDLD